MRQVHNKHIIYCREWWSYYYHSPFVIISISHMCKSWKLSLYKYYEIKGLDRKVKTEVALVTQRKSHLPHLSDILLMMDKSELVGKYKKPCVPGHYKGGSLGEAWETPVCGISCPFGIHLGLWPRTWQWTLDCCWVAETDDLHEHRETQELAEAYQQLCAGLSSGLLHLWVDGLCLTSTSQISRKFLPSLTQHHKRKKSWEIFPALDKRSSAMLTLSVSESWCHAWAPEPDCTFHARLNHLLTL